MKKEAARRTMTDPLEIDINIADDHWSTALEDVESVCRHAARAAFIAAGDRAPSPAEVSLLLTDDAQIQDLNRTYRDKDKSTNVLSFVSYEEDAHVDQGPALLGDIVIAFGVSDQEAREEGKPLADHLSHLVIHGMLHLLGHDHEEDSEAEHMETLEISVLKGLGIKNPYQTAERVEER